MKVLIAVVIISLATIIGLFITLTRESDNDLRGEDYIVSSTKGFIIIAAICFIASISAGILGTIDSIKYSKHEDIIFIVTASSIFALLSLYLFWERLTFRIIVKKHTFIVRNFFLKSHEYAFSDITDYMDKRSYIDNDSLDEFSTIEAFIENKKVISANEWDINFEKIRTKIIKQYKKNKLNTNYLSVHSTLERPIAIFIFALLGLGITCLIPYALANDIILDVQFLPFKGTEIFVMMLLASLAGIIYAAGELTERIYIKDNKITHKKFLYMTTIYDFKDFIHATYKGYKIHTSLKVYTEKNGRRKKVLSVPGHYINQKQLINILKLSGVKVEEQ